MFVAPWLCGAAAMIVDGRFEPAERLELIERERVDVLCQAPTEYRVLAKRAELRALPSLRRMVSAGEALNPEVIEAWREATGLEISDGYGQTETGHLTGNLAGEEIRAGSMGRPLPGLELRIADDELQVKVASCPTFFDRYLDGEPFAGEWWPTGDVVREDADGYLWYEGRNDDLILSAGYRIGPFEVESALLTHPAVAEAAAVPAPDPERGSVVRAIVVLRDGEPSDELARELQEHVKSVTAPYKYPRIVDFADELPKTASGKVSGRSCAAREGEEGAVRRRAEPHGDLVTSVGMPTPRSIQRTYLILMLGNTLAASFIWGINTIFLLDAGLSNAEAFAANAFFTAGMVDLRGPDGRRRRHDRPADLVPARDGDPDRLDRALRAPVAGRGAVLGVGGRVDAARPRVHVLLRRGRSLARRRARRDRLRRRPRVGVREGADRLRDRDARPGRSAAA